jgi:hypothetical protein
LYLLHPKIINMKKLSLVLSAAVFLFACNSNTKSESKTDDSTNVKSDSITNTVRPEVDSATAMKNWQEYMTPGDMHKMMASWDGTWVGNVSMWMPGAPEQKSTSIAENKMIMNGLYQEATHTGNMMGAPFNGKSMLAYDNFKKQFISTWIDNMGSGVMVMNGTWDSTSKTISFTGKSMDPSTRMDCNMRETFQVVDDSTHVMQMFGPDPKTGKEMKMMEITYKRKK